MWPARARRRWRRLRKFRAFGHHVEAVDCHCRTLGNRVRTGGIGVGRDPEAEETQHLLEQENEILRRTAAYLARDISPK